MNWFSKLRVYCLIGAAVLMVLSYKVANLTNSDTELLRGTDLLNLRIKELSQEIDKRFSRENMSNSGFQKELPKIFLTRLLTFPTRY